MAINDTITINVKAIKDVILLVLVFVITFRQYSRWMQRERERQRVCVVVVFSSFRIFYLGNGSVVERTLRNNGRVLLPREREKEDSTEIRSSLR